MALFPKPPGWAGTRRELLHFMVQGKINNGRHTDHPDGCHSIRTNLCQHPPSPIFLQAGCPSCRPTNSVKAMKATSAFGLGRRRYSSPQRCYLHRLRTSVQYKNKAQIITEHRKQLLGFLWTALTCCSTLLQKTTHRSTLMYAYYDTSTQWTTKKTWQFIFDYNFG